MDTTQVWNASNPWATPDSSALATGLAYAANKTPAVADPMSTPTTSNPASAARALGSAVQDASAVPTGGTMSQNTVSAVPMQNKLSVSQGNPLTNIAINSTANKAPGNTAAAPPQNVAMPTAAGDGTYNYYSWNPSTGAYQVAGTYNTQTKQGYTNASQAAQLRQTISDANQIVTQLGSLPGMMGSPAVQDALKKSADAQAQLDAMKFDPASLGQVQFGGGQLQANSPDSGVGQVTQQYAQGIDAYKAGQATADANQAAAAQSASVADAVAYMAAHGGQMDPGRVLPASVVSAAQDAYKAQQTAGAANPFAINGTMGVMPINTDTADIAGMAAKNAITSQYNTNLGGADAGAVSRAAAFSQAAQSGENQLTHDTAAANSFNTNLNAFGSALQAQATADSNATGQKLQQDIQNVQDVATALSSQIETLDQATQTRVKGAIDSLNQQIAYYNQMAKQYGADTAFVVNLARGVLAAGAAIATVATGGAAGVAIAGAAAAAGAATR